MPTNINLLQKLLAILNKYSFGQIMKALVLVFITGYVIFFATNPEYLIDKLIEAQEKREMSEDYKHKAAIDKRLKSDTEIRRMLSELLYQTGADRSWLVELHNGTNNLGSGLPFVYGSMRMEISREGIRNVDEDYADFPLSKFGFVSHVLQKGYFHGSAEDIKTIDERLYYNFKFNDVNQIALMILYNGDSPMGCIGLTWCGVNAMKPEKTGRLIREYGTKIAVELLR